MVSNLKNYQTNHLPGQITVQKQRNKQSLIYSQLNRLNNLTGEKEHLIQWHQIKPTINNYFNVWNSLTNKWFDDLKKSKERKKDAFSALDTSKILAFFVVNWHKSKSKLLIKKVLTFVLKTLWPISYLYELVNK